MRKKEKRQIKEEEERLLMDESHSKCISDRHSIFTSISRPEAAADAADAVTFSLLTRNRSINLQKPVPLLQKKQKTYFLLSHKFFLSALAGKIHLLNLEIHSLLNQRRDEIKSKVSLSQSLES